jgi:phenylpropionate dioxygenase-like ring-hydroxylating dioxygenase large terminal subunit
MNVETSQKSNERPTRGRKHPPQGEGGYDVGWYPVCKSEEVALGQVIARDFFDGDVAVWRGQNGELSVVSPFCRHMGADLTVGGKVVDNTLQCPFHLWKYDRSGKVVEIPVGDPIPPRACLFKFPVAERYGVVWIFNGEEALFDPPTMDIPEEDAVWRVYGPIKIDMDPCFQFANLMDFQHLQMLHKLEIERYPDVEFGKYGLVARNAVMVDNNRGVREKISVTSKITGTNILSFGGVFNGGEMYFMMGATPQPNIRAHNWLITATRKGGDPEITAQALEFGEKWSLALIVDDDQPIMNASSFRFDQLSKSDKYVGEFAKYLSKYPRAHPSQDFICR